MDYRAEKSKVGCGCPHRACVNLPCLIRSYCRFWLLCFFFAVCCKGQSGYSACLQGCYNGHIGVVKYLIEVAAVDWQAETVGVTTIGLVSHGSQVESAL